MEELSGRRQKRPDDQDEIVVDSLQRTHSNDVCVFELVLGGDKEGGEVLGKEAGEGGGVSQQDLNTSLPCNMMLNMSH